MRGGIYLFSKVHNKPDTASSRIRGQWLINYWNELEELNYGRKYDFIIYQKVYETDHAKLFDGIKILDCCISKDSLVFTNSGWKYPHEVTVEDYLLTHIGKFKKVKKIFKRIGNIGGIKPSCLPEVRVTDNHPLMVYDYKRNGYGRIVIKDSRFEKLENINLSDDKKYGKSIVTINKREIFNDSNMNENMGWFWGYYSAEGSRNINNIQFSSHRNELLQRDKITKIIYQEFNQRARLIDRNIDNTLNVIFGNRKLSRYIKENIKSHINKTVVPDIFNASVKTKLSFLEGYIAGDGYCNDYGGISVSSVSKKLAYSIWQLFRDCGIFANMNYNKRDGENCRFTHKNGKKYDGNPCWRVQLNPKESIKFVERTDIRRYKKTKIDYWKSLKSKNVEIKEKDNYLLYPIRKIDKNYIKDTVYNFEVEDDHTYIVDGIVTHNCDPDFLDAKIPFFEMVENCDVVTTSTDNLRDVIKKWTNKPVITVPDRHDLGYFKEKKVHRGRAKEVCWFGYSHNATPLKAVLPYIQKYQLGLSIIADEPIDIGTKENELISNRFTKWQLETVNKEIIKSDFIVMPGSRDPNSRFKSNNKTVHSWLLKMPVAASIEEFERFIDPIERSKEAEEKYKLAVEKYDVRISVKEIKAIIENILIKQKK